MIYLHEYIVKKLGAVKIKEDASPYNQLPNVDHPSTEGSQPDDVGRKSSGLQTSFR